MHRILFIITILLLPLFSKSLHFTSEEKLYIKHHQPITIGMLNNFKPFSYIENDTHQGLSVDILQKISQLSGLKFNIHTSKWSTTYNQFKNGQLQMISGISHHKNRESFTLFSEPYYEIPIFLFGKKSNTTYINNTSIIGKKVGISLDIFYKQDLVDMGVDVVEFASSKEKAKALALGEIDYYLASYTSGLKAINSQFLTSLKPIDEFKAIKKEDLRYGIKKDEKVLYNIVQKSLAHISSREFNTMVNKWIVGLNTPELKNLNFTKDQLDYLTKFPVIRVHNELKFPPFNYNENGHPQGFSIDYMNLLASKIGLNVEYVSGTWNELMKKIKNDDLDVMLNIVKTPNREQYLNYTTPYITTSSVAYVRNSNRKKYHQLSDFEGKKIAVIKGFFQEEFIKNNYPLIQIVNVNSAVDGLKMVSFGEVDGMLLSMPVGEYLNTRYNLANLVPVFELENSALNLHLAIRKSNPILRDILERGKNQITNAEILALKQKWLIQTGADYENRLNLSTNEKIYLKTKKQINVCINPNLMPFESLQSGQYTGLTADYMKLFEKKLNIEFKVIPTNTWINSLESIKSKKCDVLSLALKTHLVDEHLTFSLPYLQLPLVLATNLDVSFISNLEQLNGKRVGILASNNVLEKLKKRYPDINLVTYVNSKEALNDVVKGNVFGFISTVIDIGYVFQNSYVGQLKIAGKFDDTLNFRMAISKEQKELNSILNKAIRSLSQENEEKILSHYLSIKYEQNFNYDLFLKVMFVIVILIGIGMYRQYMLNKVNKALKDLAYKDQLTQLRNRHYFFDMTESIFALSKRNDDAFSILLLDIDNFKKINDTYGHIVGDEVLKKIALELQKGIRQSDILARYGGEEFIIALPNTSAHGAMNLAENIRQRIEKMVYKKNSLELSLTVSIGVCDYYDESSIETLIHNADVALYKAKQEGKNQSVEFIHRYSLNS